MLTVFILAEPATALFIQVGGLAVFLYLTERQLGSFNLAVPPRDLWSVLAQHLLQAAMVAEAGAAQQTQLSVAKEAMEARAL